MFINGWMDGYRNYENAHTHTHTHKQNRTLLSYKKENLTFCNNVDFKGIMLSEISRTGKEKYCMIPFIYGILINNPNP